MRIAGQAEIIARLQDEIRRSEQARYDHRLHGVLLVARGMTCRAAAELLGDSRRTLEYWMRRFEAQGLAGLREGDRPGRPSRLNHAQLKIIEAALRRPPWASGLEGSRWDGKLLASYLDRECGVALGVRQCQRLLRRSGCQVRRLRPRVAHAGSLSGD